MDCSIRKLSKSIHGEPLYCVSTTDFFFPLVDDPYKMGKIACANVLSDMYALGVVDVDNMLMLLSSSSQLSVLENDVCMKMIMRGFRDLAEEAETAVTGGQTVINKDLLLGGVAMSTCLKSQFIDPVLAEEGDLIVLTKPLGTQVSVNANQWLNQNKPTWNIIKDSVSETNVRKAYDVATESMTRLNRNGARLMHKYQAHACTDVTGFGILGHAQNMAKNQKNSVDFVIDTLPIISNMDKVDDLVGGMFKLKKGLSAETSGGLLVILKPDKATKYIEELEQLDKHKAYIVGKVVKGKNTARIADSISIIQVEE